MDLTPDQINFLRSLVRMEIRKRTRALEKWRVFPGQCEEDALDAWDKIEKKLCFAEDLLLALGEEREHVRD